MHKQEVKTKFIELLEKSTITQAFVTMAVVITACVLWGTGQDIPDGLQAVVLMVIGFFFGTKSATLAIGGK